MEFGTYAFIKTYSDFVVLPVDCQYLVQYQKCVTTAVVTGGPDLHAFPGYSVIDRKSSWHKGTQGALAEMNRTLGKQEMRSSFLNTRGPKQV